MAKGEAGNRQHLPDFFKGATEIHFCFPPASDEEYTGACFERVFKGPSMRRDLSRRLLLMSGASALASAAVPSFSFASDDLAYQAKRGSLPLDSMSEFIDWIQARLFEDTRFLTRRWSRFTALRANGDLKTEREMRAFLLTPRQAFVLPRDIERAYYRDFLDIGHGSTISGPHIVGRMTSEAEVGSSDRVLEVGTGSGYQSAILAHLTNQVWSVEINPQVLDRSRRILSELIERGYDACRNINTLRADGYAGWASAAPFDKIIVTCGADHIPPRLLEQLRPGGTMIIPIGKSLHRLYRIVKVPSPASAGRFSRHDIYGRPVRFIPMRRDAGLG